MDSTRQFSGLWAVILGGSSGFGLAAVEKLSHHGMNIVVLYRETAAEEKKIRQKFSDFALQAAVTILPYNINALDKSGRTLFVSEFRKTAGDDIKVRLLLHSIARGNLKPLVSDALVDGYEVLSVEDIELTAYAMSTSLLDWARLLLKEDLFYKDARIIGLTSEGAHKYWESYAAVSVAKASLESLVTYMAVELAPYGIKTNVIQAGITETPSLKKIAESGKLIEVAKKRNPMNRITTTQDVANVIYLLCTDEAFWVNGSLIHVDGGEHCR